MKSSSGAWPTPRASARSRSTVGLHTTKLVMPLDPLVRIRHGGDREDLPHSSMGNEDLRSVQAPPATLPERPGSGSRKHPIRLRVR